MGLFGDMLAAAGPLNYIAAIVGIGALIGLIYLYRQDRKARVPAFQPNAHPAAEEDADAAPETPTESANEADEMAALETDEPKSPLANASAPSAFKTYIPPADAQPHDKT